MTALTRSTRGLRRPDLVVGAVVGVAVLGVTFVDPRTGGFLLIAAAMAAVVAALALRDPAIAAVLLLVSSYGREIAKSLPGDALLYATYGLVLSAVVAVWTRRRELPKLGTLELLMALYLLWNVLSMILPHPTPTGDVWRFVVKGTVIPLGLFLAGRWFFDREQRIRLLLWVIAAFTVYSTFNAIVQIHGPKSLVFPKVTITESGWVGRAVGVFNQPVVNGVLLVIGFAVLLYLASDHRLRPSLRFALVGAAAVSLYAVQLTSTRSALLALVVVLVLGALFAVRWRLPFLVVLGAGAVYALANIGSLTSTDRSAGGLGSSYEVIDRLNIAATALRAIRENPGAGIGLNRFSTYNTDHHTSWAPYLPWANGYGNVAHENELGIAAELGIPGLLLWLAVLVSIVVLVVKAFRKLPAGEMLGQKFAFLGVAGAVVWLVNGTTVDMRLLDFANALPFLLMGISVGLHERWQSGGRATVDAPPGDDVPSPRGVSPMSGPQPIAGGAGGAGGAGRAPGAPRVPERVG